MVLALFLRTPVSLGSAYSKPVEFFHLSSSDSRIYLEPFDFPGISCLLHTMPPPSVMCRNENSQSDVSR